MKKPVLGIGAICLICISALSVHAAPPSPPPVDVNVINEPDVVVANTPFNPVPTAPAGEPFQEDAFNFDGPANGLGASILLANPGKRLEIQHVSVSALAEAGAQISCDISVIENNLFVGGHELIVDFQGALVGGDKYIGSTPIVLFASDGAIVRVSCSAIGSPGNQKVRNVRGAISGRWYDDY